MNARLLGAAAVAIAVAGCGDDQGYRFAGLVRVTGETPFVAGCNGAPQPGAVAYGQEVEPFVAADPTRPGHLVGVWQQDRWNNGGANGLGTAVSDDGGATWDATARAAFSRCAGGDAAGGGDYERATDPWVTIAPDGAVYQIGLAFDGTSPRNAVLVSRSDDGGASWGPPTTLIADDDPDVFNDKESITADPTDPTRVFAVWDRLTGLLQPKMPIGTGPSMMARLVGGTWEAARPIYDPGVDNQTIGNEIVVLPDGTLVDIFAEIDMTSSDAAIADVAVIRSTDHGDTWSAPIVLAPLGGIGVYDANNDVYVRSGGLPVIAADPTTGALYAVWEDAFGDGTLDGIALRTSVDGGLTWSPTIQVNGDPSVAAFEPAIAVAPDGRVAVTYDDLRADDPADGTSFLATAWLATSSDGGATWTEEPLTGAFDLRLAEVGGYYFLGDYQGLAVDAGAFVPFFVAATGDEANDPTDVFVRPAGG
jgi:BNR repeat-like domain